MIRAPDTVIMSHAVSYRTSRDHRLDPSSSAFVASPHPPHGMGYTVSDFADTPAQYGTPPAYYDFLSGPNPITTQDETVTQEPSPPPPPQRPTRTVRPPPCGTGGHLHHGSSYIWYFRVQSFAVVPVVVVCVGANNTFPIRNQPPNLNSGIADFSHFWHPISHSIFMEKLIGGDSEYHNTIPPNTVNIISSLGRLRVAPSRAGTLRQLNDSTGIVFVG
ncbi:hypothetical protein PIB30_069901 [Stylosanthes scabra]|uniref:Uncharacterized protein n=1 Tax=Stylosanthes scabra TaxID=79078 RepID=A0ABU6VLR7_9FABA|nr:hypothetical protein [Stylosanthes scabra]